jgi:hypothetical protein
VGAASGTGYAVSDFGGPGVQTLFQSFTVAPSSTVMLSFDMFVNNWSAVSVVNPAGLTSFAGPNQHARVDILTSSASSFSTAPADVLANLYLGGPPGGPNPYTSYGFDLTGLLGAGGTYKIRFANVGTVFFFNQGVDNVSILAAPVPEPTTLIAGALLLLPFGASTLRRLRKSRAA